jgi:uncharacterized phiE125 gp8 family phage protein
MLFHPKRITPPASLPVSLVEFKDHLRVTSDHEDDLILTYLQAAVDYLDGWGGRLGRCLVSQTWVQPFCSWPVSRWFVLPFPNVSASALVVRYIDQAGDWQVLDDGAYFAPSEAVDGALVAIKQATALPALYSGHPAPVEVQFVAGYGAATDVPGDLRGAIKLIGAALYAMREAFVVGSTVNDMPQVDRILRNHQAGMRV